MEFKDLTFEEQFRIWKRYCISKDFTEYMLEVLSGSMSVLKDCMERDSTDCDFMEYDLVGDD